MPPDNSDVDLKERLSRVIRHNGPISISHFMAESNAQYYAKGDPLGADGDFITAPEISQMFGEMVGLWIADLWTRAKKPHDCHLIELGPGRGTLMQDITRTVRKFGFDPCIHLVETSPELKSRQATLLPTAKFHDDLDGLPDTGHPIFIANEFFDALPIRQIVATPEGWRERVMALKDGEFIALPGPRPMDAVVPIRFKQAPPGTILESSPATSAIAMDIAGRVRAQGGAALFIDYGYTETATGSSLQAVRGHAKVDPFSHPGHMDLTAHVNFEELKNIGLTVQLGVNGPVPQGRWLSALGMHQRSEALKKRNPEASEDIGSAVNRLTSPTEMGELFKVLAYNSNDWPKPEGFGAVS